MEDFKTYYSSEKIIKYLCKIRMDYAQKRNKKYLLDKLTTKENYINTRIDTYDEEIIKKLDEILPKRRMWLTQGQSTFKIVIDKKTNKKENVKLTTIDKNKEILFKTVRRYMKKEPTMNFVMQLNEFINDIKNSFEDKNYKIHEPDIFPELKEKNKSKLRLELKQKGNNECRPISRFTLKDRVILSITNKFLTELFDDFFEESSLAFRAVKEIDGEITRKSHHTAINKIIQNKKQYLNMDLYVAECDMKKFYDSVNHKICLSFFYELIEKAKLKYPGIELTHATNIFKEYLNCYSFRENVGIKNDSKYWENKVDLQNKRIYGKYPWIDEGFNKSEYYKINPNDRIGVPQGGALSGLIANIVLDKADKKLKTIQNLFYVRFCDDMILMHFNEIECQSSIDLYIETINDLLLFNHHFANNYSEINHNKNPYFETRNQHDLSRSFTHSIKNFWSSKTKGPYRWGNFELENNTFPWIGFVGYEIHCSCETRIRKKSLKKEIEKQKRVVNSIICRIRKSKYARNNTIVKSAYEKLNGMSVGRIKLFNYKICRNEMCWTSGFQNLTFNSHSKMQLKSLDRNKYKQISILKKHLGDETVASAKNNSDENEEILQYHKPFSYYYQAGEKI